MAFLLLYLLIWLIASFVNEIKVRLRLVGVTETIRMNEELNSQKQKAIEEEKEKINNKRSRPENGANIYS